MRKRMAAKGKFVGKEFYGCTKYPACNGIRNADGKVGYSKKVGNAPSGFEKGVSYERKAMQAGTDAANALRWGIAGNSVLKIPSSGLANKVTAHIDNQVEMPLTNLQKVYKAIFPYRNRDCHWAESRLSADIKDAIRVELTNAKIAHNPFMRRFKDDGKDIYLNDLKVETAAKVLLAGMAYMGMQVYVLGMQLAYIVPTSGYTLLNPKVAAYAGLGIADDDDRRQAMRFALLEID